MKLSRDLMNTASVKRTSGFTYAMLTRLDQQGDRDRTEEKVLSIAALLVCVLDGTDLELSDVIPAAMNLMSDADGKYTPEFKAVRAYANAELLRSRV